VSALADPGAFQGVGELRGTVAKLNEAGVGVEIVSVVRTCVDRRRLLYRELAEVLPDLGLPLAMAEVPF
jgi:hypothetical protein